MATARQNETGVALLEWIRSFGIPSAGEYLVDLRDGRVIWEILRELDSGYFTTSLPEVTSQSEKWLSRWQNLKYIMRVLTSYLTEECGQTIPKGHGSVDTKRIAAEGNQEQIVKLAKLVLVAAINSPNAELYIQRMPSMTIPTQAALKDLIEELQYISNSPSDNGTSRSDDAPSPSPSLDPELLFEEKFGKMMAENERLAQDRLELQKELKELHGRLTRLQENNAALQERLTDSDDLLHGGRTKGEQEEAIAKELESRLQQQEDLIANQETQLADYQLQNDTLQKAVERNQKSHEKSQALQDELDLLRVERETLSKKANTVDKYKQKLQTTQALEKENQSLRFELEDLKQTASSDDQSQQQVAGLQLAIEEYKRILPKIEQDRHELQMMKRQLEFNNAALVGRIESSEAQSARDQEKVAELQKGRGGHGDRVDDTDDLELELIDKQDKDAQNAALRSKLHSLRQTANDASAKSVMLEQRLDDEKKKCASLEQRLSDSRTAKTLDEERLLHPDEEVESRTKTGITWIEQVLSQMEEQLHAESNLQELPTSKDVRLSSVLDALRTVPEQGTEPSFLPKLISLVDSFGNVRSTLVSQIQVWSNEQAKRPPEPLLTILKTTTIREAEVKDLRSRLEAIKRTAVSDTASSALQSDLENMKRENKLMASAFYDLSSRIQMSNVTLQRRTGQPRSFLNKQRQQVNQAASVRGR
ncbi:hypothetical protein MMC25_008155 [Agyrium rufum]|nr:hypothetical protein [Agyrium rufum]